MSKSLELDIVSKNPQKFYLEDVNINYSFASLEKEATRLGAKLDRGDILVADNPNKNRRKVFKKTLDGAILLYALLFRDNKFIPLKTGNGKVTSNKSRAMIEYLEY